MEASQARKMVESIMNCVPLILRFVAQGRLTNRVSNITLDSTHQGSMVAYETKTPDSYVLLSANQPLMAGLSMFLKVVPKDEWDGQITFGEGWSFQPQALPGKQLIGGTTKSGAKLTHCLVRELRDEEIILVHLAIVEILSCLIEELELTINSWVKEEVKNDVF